MFKIIRNSYLSIFLLLVFKELYSFGTPTQIYFDNYSIDDGLSNNMIECAYHDSRGWMWFGTFEGLNRFDGYKFVSFQPNLNDSLSINGSHVRSIIEDCEGSLWIGLENKGLSRFNRKKNSFTNFLKDKSVIEVLNGKDSILWIATTTGLVKFHIKKGIDKIYRYTKGENSISNNNVTNIQFDLKGNLWISTSLGIDVLDIKNDSILHLSFIDNQPQNQVECIFADDNGTMWFGTIHNGFFIYEPVSKKVEHYIPNVNFDRSLTVKSIYKYGDNDYLVGTRGGLYRCDISKKQFVLFSHNEREPNSLIYNSINTIKPDRNGNIWICTRGGISCIVAEKQNFRHFGSFPDNNKYLNDNEVYAFWSDTKNNIWIGTESGGINILNPQTNTFSYITNASSNLSSNTIKAFNDDKRGNLWVATFLGGINVININSRKIIAKYYYNPGNTLSISNNNVWAIHTDKNKNIWIGTDRGVDFFDVKTNRINQVDNLFKNERVFWIGEDYQHDIWITFQDKIVIYNIDNKTFKIFNVPGRSMFCDSKGRYWLSTYDYGLILFDKQKGVIKYYTEKDGLVNDKTYCIQEDNSGNLWISTSQGLSKFDPNREIFTNFIKNDGLQITQFYYGAGYKLPSGEMVFGGLKGFNIFNPDHIKNYNHEPKLVLTDLKIFYKPVPILNNKEAILKEDISEIKSLKIPYNQNIFTLEFAALNVSQIYKFSYEYKLEGLDNEWIDAGHQHSVVYTNLNPGKYTFKVKVYDNDNIRYKNELILPLQILPPFWNTWWFKLLIVLFTLFVLYSLLLLFTNRSKLKQELVFERMRVKQIHELDLMKMKFFTNISHEIRTPLTLIIGPINKMLQQKMSVNEIKTHLNMVNRNAQYLLRLINQLLDFRKIEAGNLKLELKKGNIIDFISTQVEAFRFLAQDKGINLRIYAIEKDVFTFFDSDKVGKIIDNLLSNALKFTNKGGYITVNISLIVDDSEELKENNGHEYIEIVVKDTGIGISESNLDKVFFRFFQSENSSNRGGTGIGLALVRELVKLHNGKISVESKLNKGSRFTILLPIIRNVENLLLPESENTVDAEMSDIYTKTTDIEEDANYKIILIVEDNPDVRLFIKSHFEPEYQIIEASDGKEGISLAFKTIPNIIISDIMMPGTDGVVLCRKLKKDERTSHIPIILLTALTSNNNMVQGIKAGADDYITKPFDIAMLRTKVENLLVLRQSLQNKYSSEMVLQPSNIKISSPDGRFLKKAIEIIEKNIGDSEFEIGKFAFELGVSRMQLYRKLNALTNMTVRKFIQDIRLKRAAQLLIQKKMNISEVAYSVGFKDLSNFRKSFRNEFGMNASEYTEKFKEDK